jgi:hypothetical protein
LFAAEAMEGIRAAGADLCWLLSRGYAMRSALKLTGDRYFLTERQRAAVMRAACSDESLRARRDREAPAGSLRGQSLAIDGFNLLTTVEAALGGAIVVVGRDGCYRDLAGVHGSYRKVFETLPSIQLVGEVAASLGVERCRWLLDSPVSNSGRLKGLLLRGAAERGWDWEVELVMSPDAVLKGAAECIVTADAAVLDRCGRWVNLGRAVIDARVPAARLVEVFPV